MRCLHYFVALVICLIILSCNNRARPDKATEAIDPKWKKIPASWIKHAANYDYKKIDTTLITELDRIIYPDSIFQSKKDTDAAPDHPMFNAISVDLDGDNKNELICLQGMDYYHPTLYLFKQVEGNWYLIYDEQIDTFYEAPTIYVANNFSKNKSFYLKRVYEHGSGVFSDGYSFYKLINNKVYCCLDITNRAYIYGWGMFLNESVRSKFEFGGESDDRIAVEYVYNFFPGSIYKDDCSWCGHEDIPLIKGEYHVYYMYDSKTHEYKIDLPKFADKADDPTIEKIACFADFGDDSLFVKAYKRQIDTTIKIGSPMQKKLLKKYLAMVDKDKTARTEEIELKSKAGNTGFYGPKKK